MPKVSIIVPIYGVENYIERCVRSLFEQTLDDVEFIFVDDCTIDRSIEILKLLLEEYDLHIKAMNWVVKIDKMPINSGLPAARRHGLRMANGDYVIHCDSDDWVDKDMIRDMWSYANDNNFDVVVCDYNLVKKEDLIGFVGALSEDAHGFFREILYCKSSWAIWNKMFRRSIYENNIIFPLPGMNMGEDMAVVIQLLYYCKTFGYIPKAYYNYCENPNSITQSKSVERIIDNYVQCAANVSALENFFKKEKSNLVSNTDLRNLYYIITGSALMVQIPTDVSNSCFIIKSIFKTWNCSFISKTGKLCMLYFIFNTIIKSIKVKLPHVIIPVERQSLIN